MNSLTIKSGLPVYLISGYGHGFDLLNVLHSFHCQKSQSILCYISHKIQNVFFYEVFFLNKCFFFTKDVFHNDSYTPDVHMMKQITVRDSRGHYIGQSLMFEANQFTCYYRIRKRCL